MIDIAEATLWKGQTHTQLYSLIADNGISNYWARGRIKIGRYQPHHASCFPPVQVYSFDRRYLSKHQVKMSSSFHLCSNGSTKRQTARKRNPWLSRTTRPWRNSWKSRNKGLLLSRRLGGLAPRYQMTMKKQGVLVTPLRHHDASDGKAQVEKSHYSHKRAKEFLFSPDHFRLHTAIWK